ncbi:MAG: GNAT family N-acetyltransferase [Candidatus Wallbacteria bacterium]|nr:GNAT family N-acetyltransferase [Candidatus Wallbacteria bacterium]
MKDDLLFLSHMLDCSTALKSYASDGRDNFMNDRKTWKAALRELHELSESCQKLSQDFKEQYPEIPWKAISGFRNVIVHDYLGINLQRIWEIIERDLTPLQESIKKVLTAKYSLRPAVEADSLEIARIHVTIFHSTYKGILPQEFLDKLNADAFEKIFRKGLESGKTDERKFFHVCIMNDKIVGYISCGAPFSIRSDLDVEVYGLYILKDYQGLGIGKALSRKMLKWMKEKGYKSFMLWALKDNLPAVKFYESLKGEVICCDEEDFGGMILTRIFFGWKDITVISKLLKDL